MGMGQGRLGNRSRRRGAHGPEGHRATPRRSRRRMDIFAAAMLGRLDIVQGIAAAQPEAWKAPGPHGISLMTHAKKGGKEAAAVVKFLQAERKEELVSPGNSIAEGSRTGCVSLSWKGGVGRPFLADLFPFEHPVGQPRMADLLRVQKNRDVPPRTLSSRKSLQVVFHSLTVLPVLCTLECDGRCRRLSNPFARW